MKTVFSNSEICHVFSNQNQTEGRTTGRSMFFNSKTIYSYGYHFPMASHHKGNLLFTYRTYSNSTAKHLNYLRRAASHINKIYCYNPENAINGNHTENIEKEISIIKDIAANLLKAKKPSIYLEQIEQVKNRLNIYLEYFKLELTKEQLGAIQIDSKESYIESVRIAKELQAAKDKKDLAKGKKLYAKYLNDWHNLIDNTFSGFYSEKLLADKYWNYIGTPTLLRVNGENIETSKNMKISIELFRRYCKQLFAGELKKDSQVIGYNVLSIDKNQIVIGCHNIQISEIKFILYQLN